MNHYSRLFTFPVNPQYIGKQKGQKLEFVDQYVNRYNIPVNDHQQLELKLINEAHRFEYFCSKINQVIKCNHDEKEVQIETAIC